jgi:hypothetical protein
MSTFRKTYRPLLPDEQELVEQIRDAAERLLILFSDGETQYNGRDLALARTKLEEAVMWAVKGVTG